MSGTLRKRCPGINEFQGSAHEGEACPADAKRLAGAEFLGRRPEYQRALHGRTGLGVPTPAAWHAQGGRTRWDTGALSRWAYPR